MYKMWACIEKVVLKFQQLISLFGLH